MLPVSVEKSGAFIELFSLPATRNGQLNGLTFAVKDLFDIAGHRTGCGNPTWLATHPPATVSAVCVEQLLAAGARCEGKTITDEIAFSLLGENHFYGTPLNPKAPERVPGGSSCGSASAVACGIVDFALGTDTGGSVRVPASNCGLWGLRTTHGVVSVAGVMPFSPTFDTVGLLARDLEVLERSASVLTALASARCDANLGTLHLITESFTIAEPEVRESLAPALETLRWSFGAKVRETSLAELCGDTDAGDLDNWRETFAVVRWAEVASCLGTWIADAKPEFCPSTAAAFKLVNSLDRRRVNDASQQRERLCARLRQALIPGDFLCLPTVPAIAPLKGACLDRTGDYYHRLLGLTSIAGIGRLPQLSMPMATASGAPVGLSIIASPYEDMSLLDVARSIVAA